MRFLRLLVAASAIICGLSVQDAEAKDISEHERYKNEVVRILKWFFPGDRELISGTEIRIIEGDPLETRLCGSRCIQISIGMIKYFPNRFEYYVILVHEFGHVRGKHTKTIIVGDFFMVTEDFALKERQELEADQTALGALRGRKISTCFLKFVLNRLMKDYPPENDPDDPYRRIIDKRLAAADAACPAETR